MQNSTLRTVIVIFLFVATAVFVFVFQARDSNDRIISNDDSAFHYVSDLTIWRRTKGEQNLSAKTAVDLDHDLRDLPLEVGDWHGQEIEQSNITALIMLKPEQLVERYYQKENGRYLWLTMIGGRQSRTFHAPEICYDSYGWDTQLSYQTIPLSEGTVQGVLVEADKAATGTEAAAQQLSFYFYLFPDNSRDPDAGIIMFRTTTPRYGTTQETLAMHGDFLSHFFQNHDFSAGNKQSAPPFQPIDQGPTAAGLKLNGYRLSHQQIPSGAVLGVDLSWLTIEQPTNAYNYDVWLADEEGVIWSQKETYRSHIFKEPPPTYLWQPEQQIWDSREVTILSGTPPGKYNIVATLYDKETSQPTTFTAVSGETVGPYPIIGQITVVPPDFPVQFQPQTEINQEIPHTGLTLIGTDLDRTAVAPGDLLPLTLYWQKTNHESRPDELILQLKDTAEHTVQDWPIPAVRVDYPATQWQLNDKLRAQHNVHLNAALESGAYTLHLNNIPLMPITINAPEREFQKPANLTDIGITFGDHINLVGYTVTPTGKVDLIWQTDAPLSNSYHVFVHLTDQQGQIITQSDGIPVNWTRPSTGWVKGEYITDTHLMTMPDDPAIENLALRVGLYQPNTNERLTTENGETFVTLPLPAP